MKKGMLAVLSLGWCLFGLSLVVRFESDAVADTGRVDPPNVAGSPNCPCDTDGSGTVDVVDLLALLAAWGPCPGCPPGQTDCGGQCVDTSTDPGNCGGCGNVCPPGTTCVNGTCELQCAAGETNCGGQCVDTNTDPSNCGACGNLCGPGEVCINGQCTLQCPPGLINCGGQCVDPSTDENHCGGCNSVCPPGTICVNGTCVTP